MALRFFTLPQIKNLDFGRVAEAWDQAVARTVSDCEDRPTTKKPRKVTMTFEVIPVADCQGDRVVCVGVQGGFVIKDTIPSRQSRVYSFGIKSGGRLVFSDEDPTNVDQTTVFDARDAEGRVVRDFAENEETDD